MKILLSAYACEPHKGSEPGVGWNWAIEIARLGHQVYVLTRANNRKNIEAELAECHHPENLKFIYYDLPGSLRWWKKGARRVYLYYFLWQWNAAKIAMLAHETENFSFVHHITFGSIRLPSFMGRLGIPLIFGPAGGGETAPFRLRKGYDAISYVSDIVRDLSNYVIRVNPFSQYTFAKATHIFVTSEESRNILPTRRRGRATIQLAIGTARALNEANPRQILNNRHNCLFVGRLLGWKGLAILLSSFAQASDQLPEPKLYIRGDGPEITKWKNYSRTLGVEESVVWVPRLCKEKLNDLYKSSDTFIFPSLHDSGGQAVLEAMEYGLPVVCFDLGGPGVIVNETCGYRVKTRGRNYSEVVDDFSKALVEMASDSELYAELSSGALARAKEFTWEKQVKKVYDDLANWSDCW